MEGGDPAGGWWKRYLKAERMLLENRRRGQLATELGGPLPDESAEELRLMAQDDERRAEEGLVELLRDGEPSHKPLEELVPEDLPARLEAEDARIAYLAERAQLRARREFRSTHERRTRPDGVVREKRAKREPVREGDCYYCTVCGYAMVVIRAPLAPGLLPALDCCGARMEKEAYSLPTVGRHDRVLAWLEDTLEHVHEQSRSSAGECSKRTVRDEAELQILPTHRQVVGGMSHERGTRSTP